MAGSRTIQSHDPAIGAAIEPGQTSADQNLSVRLHRRAINDARCAAARIESFIQTAVRIQSCNVMAGRISKIHELARHDDFSVRLNGHAPHIFVGSGASRKGRIHRSIHIQAGNVCAWLAIHVIE